MWHLAATEAKFNFLLRVSWQQSLMNHEAIKRPTQTVRNESIAVKSNDRFNREACRRHDRRDMPTREV